jgi:hypothetical protein
MSKRHRWEKGKVFAFGGTFRVCVKCGASRRGKGDKLQFIIPGRYLEDGRTPAGWTPERSWTPPCGADA